MINKYGIDLTNLLEELGLSGLSPEEQDTYANKILASLEKAIAGRIAEKLNDQELAELDTLTAEQVSDYLAEKGIDVVELAVEEGTVLRDHLLGGMSYAKGIIEEMKSE
jgi:hypothetical protein